jgi:HEAT repeat protein/tRNA A-37 threonylcarbamoyl transferase component Bud32
MNFLSALKADRLIAQIQGADDPASPAARKALERLRRVGPGAIPRIIEALGHADRRQTVEFVEVLTELTSERTFAQVARGLADASPRTVSGTAWALSSSQNFNPNRLLDLLQDEQTSKPAVFEIMGVHKQRLNLREVLRQAYELQAADRTALFKLIDSAAGEDLVPELIARLDGKDPGVRVHLIRILSRFRTKEVALALQAQLDNSHKLIRKTALQALGEHRESLDVARLCRLLMDPDMEVVNQAVDLIIGLAHPDTVRHLLPPLKNESEYARRAAVEVLNELCDTNSAKYLLDAVKDEDWWVRSRASDALAKIGGPKVINAVLRLVNDDDESIRRAAIEILNSTKDERAVQTLMQATADSDWWVRERAADALGEIGSREAVPALLKMLDGEPKSIPAAVRALGKLGDTAVVEHLTPLLRHNEKSIKVEAMTALARVVSERQAETVRTLLLHAGQATADVTVNRLAGKLVQEMQTRLQDSTTTATGSIARAADSISGSLRIGGGTTAQTLLEESPLAAPARLPAGLPGGPLDINALQSGDMIEGRYRYIERIGKGAFGTVVLVEDIVVEERLILKFLNSNFASDEEMMKRFVHELRYSRKITHKNVIRIYDFVYISGNYAISMEFFPSHTLGGEMVNQQPLPIEKALRFGCDIATGMVVAHQQGIIHRDLKPANILINDQGLLKIVDFGVAAAASSGDTQLTKTGYVIGSPKYMAPEQILGKKVDERADVYSLGVIIYEMLTGVPPYTKGDHMSVMYQHVQGKAELAHKVNPALPLELCELVQKAMSVDKNARHQSMAELQVDLQEFLGRYQAQCPA